MLPFNVMVVLKPLTRLLTVAVAVPPTEVGLMVTLAVPLLLHPVAVIVTTFVNSTVTLAPAVKVTVVPVCPPVMLPLPIVQLYVAPDVVGTDAVLPVELEHTEPGAVIVAEGSALMVMVMAVESALVCAVRPEVPTS